MVRKIKKSTKLIFIVLAALFIGIHIAYFIISDGPKEREAKAISLLNENKEIFLSHIERFNQYSNITLILYPENDYFEIEYTETPNEKDPSKCIYRRIMLDLNKQRYYDDNDTTYNSLSEALKPLGIDEKGLIYWIYFFEKYNLYAIDTAIHIDYISLTIKNWLKYPHGLIYVPPGSDDVKSIENQIPGRLRDPSVQVYEIMTYIEEGWYYFEGP